MVGYKSTYGNFAGYDSAGRIQGSIMHSLAIKEQCQGATK